VAAAGRVRYGATDEVAFGRPAAAAVAEQAARLDARRVFLLASGTLNRATDEIERVRQALGGRYAATFDAVPPHTPRRAAVAAAAVARAAKADLVVSIGGGSVTDAAKVVQVCLRHDVRDAEALDGYRVRIGADGRSAIPRFAGPEVRQVAVPTTLSGGEYNAVAGCTDERTRMKETFLHRLLVPRAVVLDPAITVHTPMWLWLSTGIRAVDHCVEGLCSSRAHAWSDASLLHGLRLLTRALPRVQAAPDDLAARLDCQFGAWLAMTAAIAGVPMGASHGIGHVLGGGFAVPHGHTSCIMLPAVLRWNRSVNAGRQALVAEAMGRPGGDAADAVEAFVAGLGQPTRLSQVGVGPQHFREIAEHAMHDRSVHTNPRPIGGPEEVLEILALAA